MNKEELKRWKLVEKEIKKVIRSQGSVTSIYELYTEVQKSFTGCLGEQFFRACAWSMIDRGVIELTPSRKLELVKRRTKVSCINKEELERRIKKEIRKSLRLRGAMSAPELQEGIESRIELSEKVFRKAMSELVDGGEVLLTLDRKFEPAEKKK